MFKMIPWVLENCDGWFYRLNSELTKGGNIQQINLWRKILITCSPESIIIISQDNAVIVNINTTGFENTKSFLGLFWLVWRLKIIKYKQPEIQMGVLISSHIRTSCMRQHCGSGEEENTEGSSVLSSNQIFTLVLNQWIRKLKSCFSETTRMTASQLHAAAHLSRRGFPVRPSRLVIVYCM